MNDKNQSNTADHSADKPIHFISGTEIFLSRLSDPVFSLYVSFVVTWNWKGFVHLWAGADAEKKITGFMGQAYESFIKCVGCSFAEGSLLPLGLNFLAFPGLLTLFWIFGWPWCARFFRKAIYETEATKKKDLSEVKAKEDRDREIEKLKWQLKQEKYESELLKDLYQKIVTILAKILKREFSQDLILDLKNDLKNQELYIRNGQLGEDDVRYLEEIFECSIVRELPVHKVEKSWWQFWIK